MKKIIVLALILYPILSFGQKFYVNTSCDHCDLLITKKLNKLGYLTTNDSLHASYKISALFKKNRAYISFKVKWPESGYLKFSDQKNEVLDSTRIQKGGASALNGFDAKADVVKRILRADFYAIVKNLTKQ